MPEKTAKRLTNVETHIGFIPNCGASIWGDIQGLGRKSLMIFISKDAASWYSGRRLPVRAKITIEYEISGKDESRLDAVCPECLAIQTENSQQVRLLKSTVTDECERPGCGALLSLYQRFDRVIARVVTRGRKNEGD